jgi:N-acetylglucosaminyl-diphospho-decaprenol L-rhamnosyltransferase
MDQLTLSVVSHGHRAHLNDLLADLNRLAPVSGLKVVLTLNIPEPEPAAREYPRLRLAFIRNRIPKGFGANHNAAFASCCTTPWFAVLNPDLRLPSDPFAALLARLDRASRIGAVSPKVLNSIGVQEDHVRRNLSLLSLLRRRRGVSEPVDARIPASKPNEFYWLAGMFLLFSSEAYRDVGGFDERFYLYCEDYDICARLYSAGYALHLVPEASVIHDAQRDSHRSMKHLRWHLSSLARVWSSRAFWNVTLTA